MLSNSLKNDLLGLKSKLENLEKDLESTGAVSSKIPEEDKKVKKIVNTEEKIKELLDSDRIIKLNIGGKVFQTKVSNLLFYKDSLFFHTLLESNGAKELFFDRSYNNFNLILDFLRNKKFNFMKLTKFEIEDLNEEIEFYKLTDQIIIPNKVEYELGWDLVVSKPGVCSLDSDDPKILKVNSTDCYTNFVTDKIWQEENFIVELESNVVQEDNYLYYGIVNENYNYEGDCMCTNPPYAWYVTCNGDITNESIVATNPIFDFRSNKTTIGMRVNLKEKTIYFYIPDKGEEGPFSLIGNRFRIVAGTCNFGTGTISILSCYDA
jgi:hypothetical protein